MDKVPTAISASVRIKPLRRPVMIDVGAQHQGPQRTHQESGSERGERQHQRRIFAAVGKKGAADARGVVAEDHEVVHLQEISSGDADHRSDF